ncbi:MAG: hypothetical protein ACKVP7_21535 [Hyphomicrobiaceae bacterium]
MSQDYNDRLKGNIKADPKRAERLQAELRENLKRRKARARSTVGDAADDPDSTEVQSPPDGSKP